LSSCNLRQKDDAKPPYVVQVFIKLKYCSRHRCMSYTTLKLISSGVTFSTCRLTPSIVMSLFLLGK